MAALKMRIDFEVTPGLLARAMAIDARDELMADCGEDHSAHVRYVEEMTKARALDALRSCLFCYGRLSWPDDYSSEAFRAARRRSVGWLAPASKENQG